MDCGWSLQLDRSLEEEREERERERERKTDREVAGFNRRAVEHITYQLKLVATEKLIVAGLA